MHGQKYIRNMTVRTAGVDKKTCTHPTIEMFVNRPMAWCKTCFTIIREETGQLQPVASKTELPEKRGVTSPDRLGSKVLVTRIDLQETPNGLVSHKFAEGWYERQPNTDLGLSVRPDWTLDRAVQWLRERGYTVRTWTKGETWYAGARAWLGELRPVRTRAQIILLRQQIKLHRSEDTKVHTFDLAYDL